MADQEPETHPVDQSVDQNQSNEQSVQDVGGVEQAEVTQPAGDGADENQVQEEKVEESKTNEEESAEQNQANEETGGGDDNNNEEAGDGGNENNNADADGGDDNNNEVAEQQEDEAAEGEADAEQTAQAEADNTEENQQQDSVEQNVSSNNNAEAEPADNAEQAQDEISAEQTQEETTVEQAQDDANAEQENTNANNSEQPPEPEVNAEQTENVDNEVEADANANQTDDPEQAREPGKDEVGDNPNSDELEEQAVLIRQSLIPQDEDEVPASVAQPAAESKVESVGQERQTDKPMVNLEATATVKFVLMPSGQVVTLACTLGQTLESLKSHFAMELKMPNSLIMLMFDGKGMPDGTTLADLGVGPNGTVQLEMQSADPVNTPLKPYRPRQEYHMPDVITVRVMTEDCEAKDVVVEIERSRTKKPFLGGFRNKNTGVEFHNAAAQTMQKPRPPPTSERFCRDTQTCEQRNTRQQTTNTTSTQMTGVGVYVSNIEDKLIVPGKYFSADDYWALILSKVIILQKYFRRWLAIRYVKKLKEDKAKRLEWERREELRKKKEKEERIRKEYARRINPQSKADFDMLLHCLEKWRQEEMERINSTLEGAERKAALCMLLDQETELLSAIERHKNEAYQDNRDKRIMAFLDKAAAPKKWQAYDGKLTFMDTPFTIRAKELRDIYNSINMKYLTQDERLDVLLTLKHTVKEHDCKLTQEIIELIDREADLLMRGVKEGNLTGLRKRISTLFLQYIKTPTFNPEAARLLKVPQDPSTLRKNINYCHSCGSYLPSTEFFITSNSRNVGRCRNCVKTENDGRQREDHNYYKVMLRALRKSEEAMQDGSNICYLLQENDLRYLVENIWSGQSILSAWNDLYDLVLCRWDKHQEWSPWNCILLTHDEAEAHKKLFSLEEGYGHVFIHKVTQKHNFARNYFSRLPGMAEALRQKLGSRELVSAQGPSVAGHAVPKAQEV